MIIMIIIIIVITIVIIIIIIDHDQVSEEAPTFATDSKFGDLLVVVVPRQGPRIVGNHERFLFNYDNHDYDGDSYDDDCDTPALPQGMAMRQFLALRYHGGMKRLMSL